MEGEYVLYYEDYLKIREEKRCWKEYWVNLLDTALVFFEDKNCHTDEFCKKIQLSSDSRCLLAKRRTYSFRFRLITSGGSFLLKCDSNLQRHRWIRMIQLAIKQKPPQPPPNFVPLPYNYDEVDLDESLTENNELSTDGVQFKVKNCETSDIGSSEVLEEKLKAHSKPCWTNNLDERDFRVLENDDIRLFRKLTLTRVTRVVHELTKSLSKSDQIKATPSSVRSDVSDNAKVKAIGTVNLGFTADEVDIIMNKEDTEYFDTSLPSEFPVGNGITVSCSSISVT